MLVCRLLEFYKSDQEKNSGSSKRSLTTNKFQLKKNASKQLSQCAHDKLCDLMLANNPMLMAKSEEYVAKLLKSVAVIKVVVS